MREANWHPLTWLSHMLDCQMFGLNRPGGHHLTNVLLHATSAVLLFLVLRAMTGDLWPSAFAAGLFAVHPLHVESVAWVSERKDVLSGLFFMLTIAAYVGYVRHPFSLLRYLLVTVLFALGLMSKPMLVTLPFVLLLLDYWPLRRMISAEIASRRFLLLLWEKTPWLAMSAASCVVTQFAQQKDESLVPLEFCPFAWRVANAVVSYATYLVDSFCPVGLAALYPHPLNTLPVWKVAGSVLLLAAVTVVTYAWRRKCLYLIVGWLWFVGMLVPVIGLVQVGRQAMADRYTYLPLIGLAVALAWGADRALEMSLHRRRACRMVALLFALVLTAIAWRQTRFWKDSETLWARAVACTSRNWLAHNNLGVILDQRGRVREAIVQFQEAEEIRPGFAESHYNLAKALADGGQVEAAIAEYQKTLDIKPDHADARLNLGIALEKHGQFREAVVEYEKALVIKPDFAEAHNSLGIALARHGRIDDAIDQFQKAFSLKPDFAEAGRNLDIARAKKASSPQTPFSP